MKLFYFQFYLERKREHDAFIAHERSEFELGKRHLANMMGISEAEMTQKDIDKSIEYLFPSGLSEPQARPQMRPPEDVRGYLYSKAFCSRLDFYLSHQL